MSKQYDYLLKFAFLGDSAVGKSSLFRRYSDDVFVDPWVSNMGVDFKIKQVEIHDKVVKMQIWDTAGEERFRPMLGGYFRGVHGFMLCYDLTCRSSFDSCERWLKEIRKNAPEHVNLMLIGNKCDCAVREVSAEEGETFGKANGMMFLETSAKDDINVSEAFSALAAAVIHRLCPPPVVFTLLSATLAESSLKLSLAKLSGENLDIKLSQTEPTVEAASRAIAQTCGISLVAVKLVTSDGTLLQVSDTLPGMTCASSHRGVNDVGNRLRCAIQ